MGAVAMPIALPPKLAALGTVMQLAFVPRDFDAAMAYWTGTMGVGPFFLWKHVAVDTLIYRGQSVRPDFSIALAQWGDVQIELIRQDNDAPSVYRDWNSNALHHIQLTVESYDEAVAACERAGFSLAMEGRGLLGSPELRFGYCDLGEYGPARYIEFAHHPDGGSGSRASVNRMKAAAKDWDGTDPVRALF